jgi:glycosyltransferase involved in cell wall biosynthesis
MDVVGGCVALAMRIPWILSERSLPNAYPASVKLWLRHRLAREAAAVISNSNDADAWWAARLPPSVMRRVIRNGIPLEETDRLSPVDTRSFGLSGERPLIVFVGRLDAGKNIETLLEVLARVTQEGPADALLCGEGVLLPKVRERLERDQLVDRIAAPGFVTAVPAVLKRAAVFLSLSRYEGMPNAVMEAAAAGCPIVLSDIPAHREVLDEQTAVFVPTECVEAVADAVLVCLRDPGAARARAARARARAETWSMKAVARSYAALYTQLGNRIPETSFDAAAPP